MIYKNPRSVPPPFAIRVTSISRPWYTRAIAGFIRVFVYGGNA